MPLRLLGLALILLAGSTAWAGDGTIRGGDVDAGHSSDSDAHHTATQAFTTIDGNFGSATADSVTDSLLIQGTGELSTTITNVSGTAVITMSVTSAVALDTEVDSDISDHADDPDAHHSNVVTVWQIAPDYGSTLTDSQEWVHRAWGAATTITECHCEVYTGTSIGIRLCLGEDTGDDTCTTQIADLTCDTTGDSATGLSQAVAGLQEITAVVPTGTVSGTVTKLDVVCIGTL